MNQSLKQVEDELRDAYMIYKELAERCQYNINDNVPDDERVFYFKPDTILLKSPEEQRQYRNQLVKRISGMPKPEPISYLGDEMHRTFVGIIQDKSTPTITKR